MYYYILQQFLVLLSIVKLLRIKGVFFPIGILKQVSRSQLHRLIYGTFNKHSKKRNMIVHILLTKYINTFFRQGCIASYISLFISDKKENNL